MLSKPPGALSASIAPAEYNRPLDFKHKWKTCLAKFIPEKQQKVKKSQERYKRNFDKRLRKEGETIRPGYHVFFRVERKEEKEKRHKLFPVSKGPFPLLRVYL